MFTEQQITIYNKYKENNEVKWHKTILNATLRNGSLTRITGNSPMTEYSSLVRIYDTSNYIEEQSYAGSGWTCRSGDLVVNKAVNHEIETEAPITELRNLYGNKNVYSIAGFDDYRKGTDLDHIKIGLI